MGNFGGQDPSLNSGEINVKEAVFLKKTFKRIDRVLFSLLKNNVDEMPVRLCKLIADSYSDARIRKLYLRRLGVIMGEGTFSNLGLRIVTNGNDTCVTIGDHVSIAPNVTFICKSSPNNGQEIMELEYAKKLCKSGNIIVDDEAWIGANVTVLPGVTIGRCSVVGAGSVVTRDVEPYSVYAGTPARKIRSLITGERVGKQQDD